MLDHLLGLNNAQKEAATHTKGPLLIVAGAGAGKTKTITHRIINLIKEGIAPEKILAVTFTNKAAKEMKERIVLEIEKNAKEQNTIPFVSTFHSLGVYIIKENAHTLGLTKYFTILDDGDTNSLIKDAIREIGLDPKQYDPRKIKNMISREKGKFKHYDDYQEEGGSNYLSKIVAQVWKIYETKKSKENSLDFDDLLVKSTKLLKDNKEIRERYQNKWEYIHIDEYQDTNEVQYLMSRLLSEKTKNICVVGDADQNIYSWRGANLKNILSFEKDYPNAKIVLLEENYRSTKNILEAANEIIKKNKYRPDKNLFTQNETGEKISVYEAIEESDEADFVATKILEILDGGTNLSSRGLSQADGPRGNAGLASPDSDPAKEVFIPPSSIAVLYRANFQSRVLEEAMLRYNVPYQVLGIKFFERKEIKDTLAYLRAALNPESLSDIKRIINFPVRGIGKVTLIKVFAGEANTLPIKTKIKVDNFYKLLEEISVKIKTEKASDVIKYTVKKSGIEQELSGGTEEEMERLENIKELATLALKYDELPDGAGIEKLLEDASLASDQDSIMIAESTDSTGSTSSLQASSPQAKNGIVKLMTVHAAKGLEFDYVFVTGLEDGLFPHSKMGETKSGEDSEEERRLFYVALTRARRKLFLSYADVRTIFGSRQINAPSEFINDIPNEITEREGEGKIKTIYL
ncbi:MAG: UvrD-helicase domain-containing protein [bacterium]